MAKLFTIIISVMMLTSLGIKAQFSADVTDVPRYNWSEGTDVLFNLSEVAAQLQCTAAQLVDALDKRAAKATNSNDYKLDGFFQLETATTAYTFHSEQYGGYEMTKDGDFCSWDNALSIWGVYIHEWDIIEDRLSFTICQVPSNPFPKGVTAHGIVSINLNGAKATFEFTYTVIYSGIDKEPETDLSKIVIAGETTYDITQELKQASDEWGSTYYWIPINGVTEALGIESEYMGTVFKDMLFVKSFDEEKNDWGALTNNGSAVPAPGFYFCGGVKFEGEEEESMECRNGGYRDNNIFWVVGMQYVDDANGQWLYCGIGQTLNAIKPGQTRYGDVYLIYGDKAYIIHLSLTIPSPTPKTSTPSIARDGTTNNIVMTCATAGASIYYTTNGTTPTENNTQYTGPITVSKNCTIKAIAVKDGMEKSSVATYNVDWFKVATPTFSYNNLQLTISTTTEGATIYYTTNGSTPTTSSTKYTGAISLSNDCTVKAIAVKDNYTNSDVATYNFSLNDVIIYENDGTDLSSLSVKYFKNYTDAAKSENGVIVVTSLEPYKTYDEYYLEDYDGNKVDAIVANDWDAMFLVSLPFPLVAGQKFKLTFKYWADKAARVTTQAHKAAPAPGTVESKGLGEYPAYVGTYLYYSLAGDISFTTVPQVFEKTVIVPNYADGMQSICFLLECLRDVNNYYFDDIVVAVKSTDVPVVCLTPTISRDGTSNRVVMTCPTEGSSIYYTTNGTTPTENNTQYTGPITVSKNCTIKAIAVKEGMEKSSVATYNVDWFKAETPTFSYNNLQLTISTTTEGATIYYTTNGSTPSTTNGNAQVYSSPISLSANTTVKAIAVKEGFNNSDVATYSFKIDDVTCQAPQLLRDGTSNRVVMTCGTSGASIYYTTDGTNPTKESARYSSPISVDHNQTIRAIAMKDGMFNSSQTQFDVDWFKVETPTFTYSSLQLIITTTTSGASIYYTTNGSDPLADLSRAILFTAPIRLDADAVIKAVAVKTDFSNSEVATYTFVKANYTCKKPEITRDGTSDRLTMSCEEANAQIYYTTDGSTPTTSSIRYTGPVTMPYNCTVRAIAARSDLFPSEVSEFIVDWLTVSAVSVAYNNGVLTLSCETEGAEIHYEIGGKDATKDSPLYTGPITLTDNREVRYVVYASGYAPISGSYTPTDFACAPVTLDYDGLNIELATTEKDATIYYTTDGSIPTTLSTRYTGKTPLTGLCTISAIAAKQYKNDSEVMMEPITYYFDGATIYLAASGHVEDALKWRGIDNLESLTIECQGQGGTVSATDMKFIQTMKELKHLNMANARFENNTVPDGAFSGMNIVSIELPSKNITTMGNVFSGCKHLAAIMWNARVMMASTADAVGITNPNLLLYVDNKVYAPQGVRNVIANGSASSIVLTDEEGSCYYCPQAFQAQNISYTHTYSQITGINECRGWETIAMPFDVQNIKHETIGKIAPFAAQDATARSFWLGELDESGFKKAAEIKAYTPYIISMPNNEVYGDSYILAGKVTFEAVNTTVPVTDIKTTSKGDHVFTPCFDTQEASSTVYAINKNDQSTNFPEGSIFMPNYRTVKPFEAYMSIPTNAVAPRFIPIREDDETGIMELQNIGIMELQNGTYDMTGRKVQGELKRGVYIVNGKKVLVK